MFDDLRGTIRLWRRDPVFPAVTALALGVGLGATCAIFMLANFLLLRPLPVRHSEELVRIGLTRANSGFFAVSYREFLQFAALRDIFAGVIAHQPQQFVLRGGAPPRQAWGEIVSSNYFEVLGLPLMRGRTFASAAADAAPPVAVISHRLWQSDFGGAETVLGRTLVLNGQTLEIIGVAAPQFEGTFAGFAIDLWVPVLIYPTLMPGHERLDASEDRFLMVMGRVAPGVDRDRARAALSVVVEQFHQSGRHNGDGPLGIAVVGAYGVHPSVAPVLTTFLSLLAAMSILLLSVICANVSGLLLARLTARTSELSIRAALGARRSRLFRQLFTESLAAAAVSGMVGLIVAAVSARWLTSLIPATTVPLHIAAPVDWRVMLFAACLCVLAGMMFSLLPIWRASRAAASGSIRDAGQAATSGRRIARFRTALLALQVAAGTVLLTGAGLLTRSAVNARAIDPGFDPSNVLIADLHPDLIGYDRLRSLALLDRLRARLAVLPGVQNASFGLFVPLGDRGDQLYVAARQGSSDTEARRVSYNLVSPGYFDVLRVPFLLGRDFDASDVDGGSLVAIVNEHFVAANWPSRSGIGETIVISDGTGSETTCRVVGVVKGFKYRTLGETARPVVFLPLQQRFRGDVVLHVRTTGDAQQMEGALIAELRAADPELPIQTRRLSSAMEFSLVPIRVAMRVVAACGVLALLIACSGVYGMVAHRVEQRLREVGIRLALGATPASVLQLVLRHALLVTGAGLVLGCIASLMTARVLADLLYGVRADDPFVIAGVLALLFAVSFAAAVAPAWRAARVSPAIVLRSQ